MQRYDTTKPRFSVATHAPERIYNNSFETLSEAEARFWAALPGYYVTRGEWDGQSFRTVSQVKP